MFDIFFHGSHLLSSVSCMGFTNVWENSLLGDMTCELTLKEVIRPSQRQIWREGMDRGAPFCPKM